MSCPIRTPVYGLVIVSRLFALQLAAACLQLDIVAKFKDANLEFDVVTVIDSEVDARNKKVALLGVAIPSRSSSLKLKEWCR
jgi:hypothetical protein